LLRGSKDGGGEALELAAADRHDHIADSGSSRGCRVFNKKAIALD
jgi:hypothetical protein